MFKKKKKKLVLNTSKHLYLLGYTFFTLDKFAFIINH